MTSKEQAKIEIERLVQRFEDHKLDYKQSGYNETQTRRDFIDPFFKALGWDVDNAESASEAYRDVIHEDKVRVENKLKSPDYSFRLNGKRCFFVEAKKPSVNVKDDVDPAYQVKRYAWSAKLKLSIVTDFEEFAIYDCSSKPKPTDKASIARIDYIKHTEYINKFDFIWDTFSKEAVQTGGYDKFVNKDKKKGTTSVDDDFLESLDLWRTALAKDIFKNNSKLSEDHLNHVVQHTIDRIIFLRIAEDRNIEVYGSIQNCLKEKGKAYKALYKLFLNAHDKYNSGLFDFEKDKISKEITISDKCLSEIIENLYFPSSPYEFSVIPVEILGSAYEQFLGKTIQIKNGKINIDEKPEVRKAGGVYYTPQYIVDYIVQNTVGKLIENKTPKEVEKIKVLDPASGSGSFLLGAYDYLLKYHHDWYSKNASKSKGKKSDPLNPDGSLTTDVKKRILLNNIYGVDIDSNAVEVTKLSLLLKCLEGETQASIQSQMTLFNERVLPTLDQNIKCGNSLISSDFFEMETDLNILKKVKPFNWHVEFKDVFKQGGFDAVIGNPPYVKIQSLQSELSETVFQYFKNYFSYAQHGNYDLYILFLEKLQTMLSQIGELGFIVPNKYFSTDYAINLRIDLIKKKTISQIVDFKSEIVFKNVSTYTCIIFLNKRVNQQFKYTSPSAPENIKMHANSFSYHDITGLSATSWIFSGAKSGLIIKKMFDDAIVLSDLKPNISRGSSSGADGIFILKKVGKNSYKSHHDGLVYELEPNILRNVVYATDFQRYKFERKNQDVIIYPYTVQGERIELLKPVEFSEKYPKAFSYLKSKKNELLLRKQYKTWYSFSAPRSLVLHDKSCAIIPLLANQGQVAKVPSNMNKFCVMASAGFTLKFNETKFSDEYLFGLLNSKLLFWYLNQISNKFRGGWITCTKQYIEKLPIKKVDEVTPQKQAHDKIVSRVNKLLELNKSAEPDQKQIQHYENQVDKLVYELYGLTEDEIKIIEEATNGNS